MIYLLSMNEDEQALTKFSKGKLSLIDNLFYSYFKYSFIPIKIQPNIYCYNIYI